MAITRNSEEARIEYIVQYLCEKYGLARSDYIQIEYQPREMRYAVMFRPAQYSKAAREHAAVLSRMLSEPLRGNVTRAAVPELAAELDELLQEILVPKPRILYVDGAMIQGGWP